MNKIEIELNGKKVLIDIERAKELGFIEEVSKNLIEIGKDKRYYLVAGSGAIASTYNNFEEDKVAISNGNAFTSPEVAQAKADLIGGLSGRITAYILEANAKDGWVVDWNNSLQEKFKIVYDLYENKYIHGESARFQIVGVPHTSKEIAQELCDKLNNGWR